MFRRFGLLDSKLLVVLIIFLMVISCAFPGMAGSDQNFVYGSMLPGFAEELDADGQDRNLKTGEKEEIGEDLVSKDNLKGLSAHIISGIEAFRTEAKSSAVAPEGGSRRIDVSQVTFLNPSKIASASDMEGSHLLDIPFYSSGTTVLNRRDRSPVEVYFNEDNDTPVYIKADKLFTFKDALEFLFEDRPKPPLGTFLAIGAEETAKAFLHSHRDLWSISNGFREFQVRSIIEDDVNNSTHIKFKQYYREVPFWGKEIIVHLDDEGDIYLAAGRIEPSPDSPPFAELSPGEAEELVFADLEDAVFTGDTELYYFIDEEKITRLAYIIRALRNQEPWIYFVDAVTGQIIEKYEDTRHHANTGTAAGEPGLFIGTPVTENTTITSGHVYWENTPFVKTTDDYTYNTMSTGTRVNASGTDLMGRTINFSAWQQQGHYFMIDTSINMAGRTDPNLPNSTGSGNIIIYDAERSGPENWSATIASSTNPHFGWDPACVSMLDHMRKTYSYYRNNHNRDSFNNAGANIVAVVNVGENYENASWNPAMNIMDFGSGLVKNMAIALDIAAHEFTHGVVDHTANFEYRYQPGALHEAYADIMSCMVDDANWLIGEDIYDNPPMRSIPDPANSLGSSFFGPLPKHMDEYYNLDINQNLGGVHINCTIPSHAAYLMSEGFSGNQGIGRKKTADIFYRALVLHLTRQSQFSDTALAVIQSAAELYGQTSGEVNVVKNAWAAVGLHRGADSPVQEPVDPAPPVDEPSPIKPVEGDENYLFLFGLWYMDNYTLRFDGPYLGIRYIHQNTPIYEYVSEFKVSDTRAVIIDDGESVLFVNSEGALCVASIFSEDYSEEVLTDSSEFEVVTIAGSKNGRFFAFTWQDIYERFPEPFIHLIDLEDEYSEFNRDYPLYSPDTEHPSIGQHRLTLEQELFAKYLPLFNGGPDIGKDTENYYNTPKPATRQGGKISPFYAYNLEFTPGGDSIVFDALYEMNLGGLNSFNYWNIGIMDIRTGFIENLITYPEQGLHVANVTVANTIPGLIAFDLIDFTEKISGTLTFDLNTGALGVGFVQEWPSDQWLDVFSYPGVGSPSFNSDDASLVIQKYRYTSEYLFGYLYHWSETDLLDVPLVPDGAGGLDGCVESSELLARGEAGTGNTGDDWLFYSARAFRRGELDISPILQVPAVFSINGYFEQALGTGEEVQKVLTISNTGNYPVVVERCDISGVDSGSFNYQMTATQVNPGKSMDITLKFTPARIGQHGAELLLFTNDLDNSIIKINLRGNGMDASENDPDASDILYGDVNGDGAVNVTDAVLVLRSIVGLHPLSIDEKARADVNLDGVVNVTDAVLILRFIVGLQQTLPAV